MEDIEGDWWVLKGTLISIPQQQYFMSNAKLYWASSQVFLCLIYDIDVTFLRPELRARRDLEWWLRCVPLPIRIAYQGELWILYIGRVLRLRRSTHWHVYVSSFDSLLSRAGLGHLGKGWIVRDTTTRRLPFWANGLFYPSWNRLYRFTAYR